MRHRNLFSLVVLLVSAISLGACSVESLKTLGSELNPSFRPVPSAAGKDAINGIDMIPQSMLKLSPQQMQRYWSINEFGVEGHLLGVGRAACQSYVTDVGRCARSDILDKTLTSDNRVIITSTEGKKAPFTGLLDDRRALVHADAYQNAWLEQEMRAMGTKIATYTTDTSGISDVVGNNGDMPWSVVGSAGNAGTAYKYSIYEFLRPENKSRLDAAIAADKVLIVAGWDRDANGNYVQHRNSSNCYTTGNKLDEGCIWAQFVFSFPHPSGGISTGGGTSYSAPNVSAALASILAVFPETTPQSLVRFAKACAKRRGEGIEKLLATSGGFGVADFTCMGGVVLALQALPTGGDIPVTINGNTVNLSDRALTLSFNTRSVSYLTDELRKDKEEDTDPFSLQIIPNGEQGVMMIGILQQGDYFASLGVGTYESFFGYARHHGQITGTEYALGHRNLFVHASEITSRRGNLVSFATGRSFGIVVQEQWEVADNLKLGSAVSADKFLGGKAKIPFGWVTLNEGDWTHGLNLSAEYSLGPNAMIEFGTDIFFLGDGEREESATVRFRRAF